VNPFLSVAVLVGVVSLLVLLPVVPALAELRSKSDALPLTVVQQNAGEIRHFAHSFRSYIQKLEPVLQQCTASGTTARGPVPDGGEYFAIGGSEETPVFLLDRDSVCPFLIVAGAALSVPAGITFANDVYAAGRFLGGQGNTYRAILGEDDVHLGPSSRVLRWVHATGRFTAEAGSRLYGRASSDAVLRLQRDCAFLRLNAPRIEVGLLEEDSPVPETVVSSAPDSSTPQRFLRDGDFEIAAGEVLRGNLVIRGNLRVQPGARICGSVKSGGDLLLQDGVSVEGSLISGKNVRLGRNCSVHGPVIAERSMFVASGTRCGNPSLPTTVSALHIQVQEGVVVHGTLWARETGEVVPRA